jgi:hypothetical protein
MIMIRLFVMMCLLAAVKICSAQNAGWTKGNPVREDLYDWNPYGYINSSNALDRVSKKLPYSVVFKDSTKLITMGKIGEHKGNFYLYVDNETVTRSIRPNETLSITYLPKKGEPMVGMPTDSCWIFKLVEGDVNLYAVTPQPADQFVIYVESSSDNLFLKATKANFRKLLKKDQGIGLDINTQQFSSAVRRHNKAVENEKKKKPKNQP